MYTDTWSTLKEKERKREERGTSMSVFILF